jgi:hypothetical protein
MKNICKNNEFTPMITYINVILNKSAIYKENKKRSGIYHCNKFITGKSYVGSSINLGNRLSTYYSKKAMLKLKLEQVLYIALC